MESRWIRKHWKRAVRLDIDFGALLILDLKKPQLLLGTNGVDLHKIGGARDLYGESAQDKNPIAGGGKLLLE